MNVNFKSLEKIVRMSIFFKKQNFIRRNIKNSTISIHCWIQIFPPLISILVSNSGHVYKMTVLVEKKIRKLRALHHIRFIIVYLRIKVAPKYQIKRIWWEVRNFRIVFSTWASAILWGLFLKSVPPPFILREKLQLKCLNQLHHN